LILEEWRGYFLAVGSGSAPTVPLFPHRRWGDYIKNVVFYVSKIKVLEFCNKLYFLITKGVKVNYTIETLISENDIKLKISELANQIRENYKSDEEIIFVGLLRGSVIFLSDLARELSDYDVKIDFMTVSSYGKSMESSRDVKVKKDLEEDIQNKNVLIVEDIIDTGYTLKKVFEMLTLREPKTLEICTLLDKPERREVEVKVKYTGFKIPDEFVVGYGIDYAEKHRNLKYIGKVVMNG
jgi:hypoxanthine phosphoribosyltransferase